MGAWVTSLTLIAACAAAAAWPGAASAANAPATNFDSVNHTQNVFWAGLDGSLREITWKQGVGWSAIKQPVPAELPDREWRADPSDGMRPLLHIRASYKPEAA